MWGSTCQIRSARHEEIAPLCISDVFLMQTARHWRGAPRFANFATWIFPALFPLPSTSAEVGQRRPLTTTLANRVESKRYFPVFPGLGGSIGFSFKGLSITEVHPTHSDTRLSQETLLRRSLSIFLYHPFWLFHLSNRGNLQDCPNSDNTLATEFPT